MHLAVQFEYVLFRPDTVAPILDAVDIVRSCADKGRVSILAEESEERVERFCSVHRIDNLASVISGCDRPGDEPLLLRQVAQLRASEGRLDTVMIADPTLVVPLLEERLAVNLFLPPGSVRPRWLPDGDRVTWTDIEKAADNEGVLRRG